MSKETIELEEELKSLLDLDLDKVSKHLSLELEGLRSRIDIKKDDIGVALVEEIKQTTTILVAAYSARLTILERKVGKSCCTG